MLLGSLVVVLLLGPPSILGIHLGFDADITLWGFIASVRIEGYHECGGTLIHPRIIVTAAQCVFSKPVRDISVEMGTAVRGKGKGKIIPVTGLLVHEMFKNQSTQHDIALLWLKWSALGGRVRKLPLTEKEPKYQDFGSNAGWGERSLEQLGMPRHLHHGMTKIQTRNYCAEELRETVGEGMLCTFYDMYDICPGDYGGPLIYAGTLIGIAVEGHGCGYGSLPSLYTSVFSYRGWIQNGSNTLMKNK
ncbi:hypothetical protein KR018_008939 [Drosophila ironensis]|nr:hypothetical protein KR018_008939 [Drosophila ironensis]